MNKKEILEIRKQFTPENSTITRIATCYVDGEKNRIIQSVDAFHSLPEEEAFKYYELFKKTLSGTLGKNLINMDFPLEEELEGGHHHALMKLRESALKNEEEINAFFDSIIEHYNYGENYLIILIHANYDIPGKSSDGLEMFDASDQVYEYMLCSICPVKLSKPGLGYNHDTNRIEERIRDWIVEVPAKGFLFPAFHDRQTDLHSVLYCSKNPEEIQPAFIENLLGSHPPLSARSQSETFQTVISETLGTDCDIEIVKNIHDTINEKIEANKENPEPLVFSQQDVKQLLVESGVPDDKLEQFDLTYEQYVGEREALVAGNITNTSKFSIESPDVIIKINPARTDLIETRIVDGRQCLVITMSDHIEVNGIPIQFQNSEDQD